MYTSHLYFLYAVLFKIAKIYHVFLNKNKVEQNHIKVDNLVFWLICHNFKNLTFPVETQLGINDQRWFKVLREKVRN